MSNMFSFANVTLAILFLIILVWVSVDFAVAYSRSKRTGVARLWDAGRGSATIVWSQFGLVVTAIIGSFNQVASWVFDAIGHPEIASQVHDFITQYISAKWVAIAMAAYLFVSIKARLRTLK